MNWYHVLELFTADEGKDKIDQSIKQFDDLTCVRWVLRSDSRNTVANLGHDYYVRIVNFKYVYIYKCDVLFRLIK